MGGRGADGLGGGYSGGVFSAAQEREIMKQLPDKIEPISSLPALKGTEKQVEWAEKIRRELIPSIINYATTKTSAGNPSTLANHILGGKPAMIREMSQYWAISETKGEIRSFHIKKRIESYNDSARRYREAVKICKNDSASFWIENRYNSSSNYMMQKFKKLIDGK